MPPYIYPHVIIQCPCKSFDVLKYMTLGTGTNFTISNTYTDTLPYLGQGCIFPLTCSYPELTEDHVLTSAYIKIFRTVTRNAVNKSVWRKKDCSWPPLNKYAMNIWLSSLRIRARLSWRTGKHLHVLHVLELTPRARIPDTRIPQLMQPCLVGVFQSPTTMNTPC